MRKAVLAVAFCTGCVGSVFAGNSAVMDETANKNAELQVAQAGSQQIASASEPSCDSPLDWRQAKSYENQRVAVRGLVADYSHLPNVNGRPTWINIGNKYPARDRLSVVIWGNDRSKFGFALSDRLVEREICVIGIIKLRHGTPQVVLKWPRDLVFQ